MYNNGGNMMDNGEGDEDYEDPADEDEDYDEE